MGSQTTKPYRNTLSGSIGAGMGSLFAPGGKKYYILEHRVTSKFHRAGESQEIIVDNIELGRDPHCQVRFDESFKTVSRHHAAIVRDGDMWKLVQISKTNTTFLNGHPVRTEWYLQNGDEIQLSVNGPKLGFIVPTGKKSTVGSIGLTRRLSLFRQQALRPYKTAITVLSCFLVLAVGGLTTWNFMLRKDFEQRMADAKMEFDDLKSKNENLKIKLKEQEKKITYLDSLQKIKPKPIVKYVEKSPNSKASELAKLEEDVFFIQTTKVVVTDGTTEFILKNVVKDREGKKKKVNYGWIATGFLCDDGRFITAKHCVEGWKFFNGIEDFIVSAPSDSISFDYYLTALNNDNLKIVTYIRAVSSTKELYFKSTDFKMENSTEERFTLAEGVSAPRSSLSDGTDWAYTYCDQKGKIKVDAYLSANMAGGIDLDVLGFPHGWGAIDTNKFSCLYGSCRTARSGLDNGLIKITGRNYESGNSGGPVFCKDSGKYKAIGIVSYERSSTMGGIVPVCNLK